MKIVHLCLGCFFPDNYSYQENMLPKFHKQLGYEVEVIASLVTFDKNGKGTFLPKGSTYINEYGIQVTRLNYKKPYFIYKKLKRYVNTYSAIDNAKPDVLFIHGCQFLDMDLIVKYLKKHENVKVYVDNHADFSNSGTNFFSKNLLHKIFWRRCAQLVNPFTIKFYGVLPARVKWLQNMYKLPKDKCELLVMGSDDDKIKETIDNGDRKKIREKYGIRDNDFLVMTGGKIDKWKTQTLLLMQAIHNIESKNVKLIVFGSVTQELKNKVETLCDGYKVQYIGWVKSEDSYKYWSAADIAVFPGRHSVFWEQVAGMGIPMICKSWEGTKHVNICDNVIFTNEDSVEIYQKEIEALSESVFQYNVMKENAKKAATEFSYKDIARRSIQQREDRK